jgi:hypothetical protein
MSSKIGRRDCGVDGSSRFFVVRFAHLTSPRFASPTLVTEPICFKIDRRDKRERLIYLGIPVADPLHRNRPDRARGSVRGK